MLCTHHPQELSWNSQFFLLSGRTKHSIHHAHRTGPRPPALTSANLQTRFWLSLSLNIRKEGLIKTNRMWEVKKRWERWKQAALSPASAKGLCGHSWGGRFCSHPNWLPPVMKALYKSTFSSERLYSWSLMQRQEKKQLPCKESSKSEGKRKQNS